MLLVVRNDVRLYAVPRGIMRPWREAHDAELWDVQLEVPVGVSGGTPRGSSARPLALHSSMITGWRRGGAIKISGLLPESRTTLGQIAESTWVRSAWTVLSLQSWISLASTHEPAPSVITCGSVIAQGRFMHCEFLSLQNRTARCP